MNPGAPQGVGRYRGVPVAAMPGNPVSASVSFEVFVRPALRAAMGLPVARPRVMARLTEALESPGDKRQFRRGTYDPAAGTVAPVGGSGSHLLAALARSNCLIDIPQATTALAAGEPVEIMRTGGI
jgi:molybdopterin molybdotransferase